MLFARNKSGNNAKYILTFKYDAQFDVQPWVIQSFTLTLTEAASQSII